jgi:hypothetical protein
VNGPWAVVVAALGAAFLTIAGTFWLERWRLARSGREADEGKLREACVQMDSHALRLVVRANAIYLTALVRSGLGEGLDILLHQRKPLDPMELTDWLSQDFGPMLEAQSFIELVGDRDLIQAAASLVVAAVEVVGKASSVGEPLGRRDGESIRERGLRWGRRLAAVRKDPELEKEIQRATRDLGRQVRRFASVTRKRLGVNDPDAVVLAFPELFADDDSAT